MDDFFSNNPYLAIIIFSAAIFFPGIYMNRYGAWLRENEFYNSNSSKFAATGLVWCEFAGLVGVLIAALVPNWVTGFVTTLGTMGLVWVSTMVYFACRQPTQEEFDSDPEHKNNSRFDAKRKALLKTPEQLRKQGRIKFMVIGSIAAAALVVMAFSIRAPMSGTLAERALAPGYGKKADWRKVEWSKSNPPVLYGLALEGASVQWGEDNGPLESATIRVLPQNSNEQVIAAVSKLCRTERNNVVLDLNTPTQLDGHVYGKDYEGQSLNCTFKRNSGQLGEIKFWHS